MAADTSNFYFKSFVGDYYLDKVADGTSKLRVVEEVTAVFPTYNQNKGICRQIPYTNQGGANVTLESLTTANLSLKRNGVPEPIYSLTKEGGYYNVCTGDETFVTGEQVYEFQYEFARVVTDFYSYQELYWDTNGTGSKQRFDSVVARVHFADAGVYDGQNWCYVGRRGEKGEARCKVTEIQDGLMFAAQNLGSYENLTFDVLLKPGSFVVPEPTENYLLIIVMVGIGVVCALIIVWAARRFMKVSEKRRYYNAMFVKPEYQAPKEYSVDEMAANYIGKKENAKVAMLLDMVVKKKLTIRKVDKKKWALTLNAGAQTLPQEELLLQILNGGDYVHAGEEFEVMKHGATQSLVALAKKLDKKTEDGLAKAGLVEQGFKLSAQSGSLKARAVTGAISALVVTAVLSLVIWATLTDGGMLNSIMTVPGAKMVGQELLRPVVAGLVGATAVVTAVLRALTKVFSERTKKGLLMSRYMDGLKLYIEMAEAERMKVLQSVKGADTSTNGVVKLYEKLLPYAAVFGLEESWMKELEKYYRLEGVKEPDWYRSGITPTDMMIWSRTMSDYSRITTMASSSSSGSGSFGGGFSGGGGGGGGFSGR